MPMLLVQGLHFENQAEPVVRELSLGRCRLSCSLQEEEEAVAVRGAGGGRVCVEVQVGTCLGGLHSPCAERGRSAWLLQLLQQN